MSAASEPVRRPSFSDLTRERPFMRLWSARLCGTAASQMLLVAIGWHMYDLTASAYDLGLVGLCQFAPALHHCYQMLCNPACSTSQFQNIFTLIP